MLIVHPSSTCDVCLEPFSWDSMPTTPHVIACGHVFCLQCVLAMHFIYLASCNHICRCFQSTHPSNCPLCRKPFDPNKCKKLHVDPYAPGFEQATLVHQAYALMCRLAEVSGENVDEERIRAAIAEVNSWFTLHSTSRRSDGTDVQLPLVCLSVSKVDEYANGYSERSTDLFVI